MSRYFFVRWRECLEAVSRLRDAGRPVDALVVRELGWRYLRLYLRVDVLR